MNRDSVTPPMLRVVSHARCSPAYGLPWPISRKAVTLRYLKGSQNVLNCGPRGIEQFSVSLRLPSDATATASQSLSRAVSAQGSHEYPGAGGRLDRLAADGVQARRPGRAARRRSPRSSGWSKDRLAVRRTLAGIGVPAPTFYRWYDRYREHGPEGLEDRSPKPDWYGTASPTRCETAFSPSRSSIT